MALGPPGSCSSEVVCLHQGSVSFWLLLITAWPVYTGEWYVIILPEAYLACQQVSVLCMCLCVYQESPEFLVPCLQKGWHGCVWSHLALRAYKEGRPSQLHLACGKLVFLHCANGNNYRGSDWMQWFAGLLLSLLLPRIIHNLITTLKECYSDLLSLFTSDIEFPPQSTSLQM